jgi:hypothetical protein
MTAAADVPRDSGKVATCGRSAIDLATRLVAELARPGVYAERTIRLRSVDGVISADVTSVEHFRWDVPRES